MKILRMLPALFMVQFVVVPVVQAQWMELPWLAGKKKVAIGSAEHIWSANVAEAADPKKYTLVFEKWDGAAQAWKALSSQQGLEPFSSKFSSFDFISASDGTLFVALPSHTTEEFGAFDKTAVQRSREVALQELKKMGKDDLRAELEVLSKKAQSIKAWDELLMSKLNEDELRSVSERELSEYTKLIETYRGDIFLTPLYKRVKNTFEKLVDIPSRNGQVKLLGVIGQTVWLKSDQQKTIKNTTGEDGLVNEQFIGKVDGSTFSRVVPFTNPVQDTLALGLNGEMYLVQQDEQKATSTLIISKLIGSAWHEMKRIQLPAHHALWRCSFVDDGKIWLALRSETDYKTTILYWNGRRLENKGSIDRSMPDKMVTVPGLVLVKMGMGQGVWYQWSADKKVEPAKKK